MRIVGMIVSFHPRTCQGQGKQNYVIATKTNAIVAVVKLVGFKSQARSIDDGVDSDDGE